MKLGNSVTYASINMVKYLIDMIFSLKYFRQVFACLLIFPEKILNLCSLV